jgi:hypothetical protein
MPIYASFRHIEIYGRSQVNTNYKNHYPIDDVEIVG